VRLLAALAGVVAGVTGCSLFHHSASPQQQFMGAVQRGNSAQASQLWLKMSAADRANFAHGIGFKPDTSKADLKAELTRHQRAMEAAANADSGGDFAGSSQTVEYPGLDADLNAGSLQNLPHLATMNVALPPTSAEDARQGASQPP
jgi:hypothetical protein